MRILCSISTAVKVMIAAFVTGLVVGIIVAGATTGSTQPEQPHGITAEHNLNF
jgi:hypothetical protein